MTAPLPDVNTALKTAKTYAVDLGERVVWSFLGGTVAVIVAAGPADMFNATFWQAAGTGGVAAVVSLVKGLVARGIGAANSASTAPRV
jgi:hypothetical protein